MAGTLLYSEAYEIRKESHDEGRNEEREQNMIDGIRRAMDKHIP